VQPVKVNYQDENIAVVSKGLQPGQTVVVGGQSRLTNGARVAVGQARAPPRVGAGGRKES
jgi:membrane fusion protein, multidrug efflux system